MCEGESESVSMGRIKENEIGGKAGSEGERGEG